MSAIEVTVTGPEEAYSDARADGSPWPVDTTSLARALADARDRLPAY